MSLGLAVGQVAPLYNLGFVIIAVFLFIKLFNTKVRDRRVYLTPWKYIFAALCIYIVEEGLTVLRKFDLINIPVHINGFFEVVIVTLFIYAVLKQKDQLKKKGH